MELIISKSKILKGIIIGTLLGVLTITILMVITAVAMKYTGLLNENVLEYLIMGILAVGSFVGGYTALRIIKRKGLFIGAIIGAMLFIILLCLGLFTSTSSPTLYTLLKGLSIIVPSIVGGIMGVNYSKKIKI